MGLSLSTDKYKLEHSFLPVDHKNCCIPLYDYEFFIATSPCKFIFKEANTLSPEWIYYEGYIVDITKDGFRCTEVCDEKLESKGKKFANMSLLTDFIKENNTVISKPATKRTDTYTYVSINNNYLNQMV
tara:strand:+ start:752 stop:1138 length:387 start_codon:yes stop_codon:yes gene_type:complete